MRLVFILLTGAVAAAAQTNCSIGGTVIDRITRLPVPRAKLTLQLPRATRSGAADNSGNWSFTDLDCVRVTITATRFGYLDIRQTGDAPLIVSLAAGSPERATIELMPQAVISGAVTDENGDPVMSVRVVPYVARVEAGKRVMRNAPQTVTDDRGEFRIPQLDPGRYIVCAQPAIGQQEYRNACYPADLASGVASTMAVRPGEETNIDFSLTSVRRVRVSGAVTGVPEGEPVNIQLARTPVAIFEPRAGTAAAPDGTFTLPQVAPGSYLLLAHGSRDGQQLFARLPIEVGASDIGNVSLTLAPDLDLQGTLTVESPSSGADLSRFRIALLSSEPDGRPGLFIASDDRHSFTLTGVSPGTYSLLVMAPGFYVKSANLNGRDILHDEFTIDASSGPINVVISDRGGALDGDVVLDDGSPAIGASVILLRNGEFAGIAAVTNGHFNMVDLQPGDYAAYAWDNTRNVEYADSGWMKQHAGAGVPLTIAAGQNAGIKLTRQTAPAGY